MGGHGSGSTGETRASRTTVAGETGRPACAAAAAARRASAGAVAGFTLLASTASPSCSTMPSASGVRSGRRISRSPASVKAPRPGPSITRPTRCQVRSLACTTVRPMADTCRSNMSRSSRPMRAATASWSCCCSRSVALPVTVWTASRTSSSADLASSRPWCGQSATQEAATARITTRSRRPPRDSLRSGVVAKASSPLRSARSLQEASSAGNRSLGVGPPVGEHPAVQGAGQLRIAGDVAQVEQSQGGRQVLLGDLAGSAHRAHRVIESDPGIPDRVPEPLGQHLRVCRRRLRRMQQHQVEVGKRRQFPPPESTDGDQRDPADVHPGLGGQAGQPAVCQSGKSPASGRTGDAGPAQQLGSQFRGIRPFVSDPTLPNSTAAPNPTGRRPFLTVLPDRARRCGPARRSRRWWPRPCRHRSCRCGPP